MSAPYTLPHPLAAALDALLAPPTDPRPVATDERSQAIRREIAKLESLSGDPPDWRSIADLGIALLRDSGKDLLFGAYTAFALAKLHALPGVHLGVLALTRLLATPALTPAHALHRGRALDWYLTRLRAELLALALVPDDAIALRTLPDALRALRTGAQEHLASHAPSFGPILQALEALLADLPDALESTEAATPASPAPQDDLSTTPGPAPSTPPELPAISEDPLDALRNEAAPWLAPVDATNPCGPDPGANEAFTELRAEVQKLSSIVDNAVDWPRVETRSGELLQRLAKDLRVAAWFTLARHRRLGLRGLALGIVVTGELLRTHGPAIHPQQPRARRMISEWFVGQIGAALVALREPLPAEVHSTLQAACDHLGAVFRDRLGGDAPSYRPIRDALQQIPLKETSDLDPVEASSPSNISTGSTSSTHASPAPTTSPTSSAAVQPGASPPSPTPIVVNTATSVGAPADLTQVDKFLDATDDAFVQTARALREARPSDPRAYRLLRLGIWLRMLAPPPAKPDGTTGIPGLGERDRDALAALAYKETWLELVHRSENLLRMHRLVLDLQRYTGTALAALGAEYAPATLTLRAELCALLLRFPTLPSLRDKDGAPLADPETQRWLSEHVLPRSRATQPPTSSSDPDPTFWTELPARLRGDTRDAALTEAQSRIDQSPSRHLRFTRGLTLAESALEAGDPLLASLLFSGLAGEAERAGLDAWDPPLVVRCLSGAARSHHRRGHSPARDIALQRLSHLDAPTAVALLAELP